MVDQSHGWEPGQGSGGSAATAALGERGHPPAAGALGTRRLPGELLSASGSPRGARCPCPRMAHTHADTRRCSLHTLLWERVIWGGRGAEPRQAVLAGTT